MKGLIELLISIPAIMIATTIHEFTRAAVSSSLGDLLPKEEGRLTLNPLKHFEPIGLILMLSCGFGWGKPVNTSALHYKNRKTGTLITAILPTIVNLMFGFVFVGVAIALASHQYYVGLFFQKAAMYCCCLVVYNLLPVSPMDCVKVLSVLLPANAYFKYLQYEKIIQVAFLLILFLGYGGIFYTLSHGLYSVMFFLMVSIFI